MARTVELRSAKDGSTLTFKRLSEDAGDVVFECRYVSPRFSGTVEASTYYVEPLSHFFVAIAENWKSEQTWSDIDGMISLRSSGDSLGHVSLRVVLRHYEESVVGEVELELGQLEAIAASTREIFG